MITLKATINGLRDHLAFGRQEEGHTLLLDRPHHTGGTELGFNGGHLMLLGWGACFKSNLVAAAEAGGVELLRFQLALEGELVPQPNRFGRLVMRVDLEVDGEVDPEHLVRIVAKGCSVSNTLTSSDAEVEL